MLAENGGIVKAAAEAIGLGRTQLYAWRKEDEAFRAAWDAAIELGNDVLLAEVHRRAVDGVDKPIFQQGKKVGTVREYSDTLLIVSLKMRGLFKDKVANEHSGPGGGPIPVERVERIIVDPANPNGPGVPAPIKAG